MTPARVLLTRLSVIVVPALTLVLLAAAPASAHATLTSSTPASGSVVHGTISTVSVTFDESVGVSSDSLRVYDPAGSRVDVDEPTHTEAGHTVSVALQPNLSDGTYTVAWQVTSADSHPVSGAYFFSVGHPSHHIELSSVQSRTDRVVQVGYDVVRGVGFLAFAVFAGGLVLLLGCRPPGPVPPGARSILTTAWALSLVTAVASFGLQGPYASDAGLGNLVDATLLHRTLDSRLGVCLLVRVALLLAAGLVAFRALHPATVTDRRRGPGLLAGWVCLVVAMVATWSLAGHASVGLQVPLSVATDIAHLFAASVWVGGLMLLAASALRDPDVRRAWDTVGAFSPLALWCVVVIITTGTYETWRNVGHWAALVDTTYGLLLLAKIGCLIVLVGLGYLARTTIGHRFMRRPPHLPADELAPRILRRLRVGVACETAVAVIVLGLTSVLVSTVTGREAYTPVASATEAFDTGTRQGDVTILVTPATLGPQTVRLTITGSDGRPYQPVDVSASLTLPDQGIGPLTLQVSADGGGRYHTRAVPVGIAGTWIVSVTIRSDDFNETTVTAPAAIR